MNIAKGKRDVTKFISWRGMQRKVADIDYSLE